eukprot:jgi/Botrbrau1/10002/Bobra.0012s0091.1
MARKKASVVEEDNDVAEAEEALPPAGRKRGKTKDGAAAESGAPAKTKKGGKNTETEKTAGPATTSGKTSKSVAGKKRSVKGQATEQERGEDLVVQEEAPAPGIPQKEENVQVAKGEPKKKKEKTAAPAVKSSKAKKAVAAEPPEDAQDQEPEVAVTKRKNFKAVKGSKKPATKASEASEDPTGETGVSSAAQKDEAPPAAARNSRRTAARSAVEDPKVAETGIELKASKTSKKGAAGGKKASTAKQPPKKAQLDTTKEVKEVGVVKKDTSEEKRGAKRKAVAKPDVVKEEVKGADVDGPRPKRSRKAEPETKDDAPVLAKTTVKGKKAPAAKASKVAPKAKTPLKGVGAKSKTAGEKPKTAPVKATASVKKTKSTPLAAKKGKEAKKVPGKAAAKAKGAVKTPKKAPAKAKAKTPKSAKRKVEEEEGKDNEALRPKKRVKVEKEVPALERIFHPSHGKVEGFVYVTGTGDCGQFGMGEDIIEALRPKQSPVLDALVVQVAAGGMHSVALGADGAVYTTGVNDEGALGRKTGGELWQKSELLPEGGVTETETWSRVDVPTVHGPVVQVSAGDSHTVALTAQGFLYGWGTYRDSSGVFGFSPKEHIALLPTLVYSPKSLDEQVVKVDSGADHTVALTREGTLLSWGTGQQGQLGRIGERLPSRGLKELLLQPHPILFAKGKHKEEIIDFACGTYSTFVLRKAAGTEETQVYAFGLNNYGQLGFESEALVRTPEKLPQALLAQNLTQVAAGEHHSLAKTVEGKVLAWGRPTYGRLGRADVNVASDDPCPNAAEVSPDAFEGEVITSIFAGPTVSGGFTKDGRVFLWGGNTTYQLGKGNDDSDSTCPTLLKFRTEVLKPLSLAFGGQHALLLLSTPESVAAAEAALAAPSGLANFEAALAAPEPPAAEAMEIDAVPEQAAIEAACSGAASTETDAQAGPEPEQETAPDPADGEAKAAAAKDALPEPPVAPQADCGAQQAPAEQPGQALEEKPATDVVAEEAAGEGAGASEDTQPAGDAAEPAVPEQAIPTEQPPAAPTDIEAPVPAPPAEVPDEEMPDAAPIEDTIPIEEPTVPEAPAPESIPADAAATAPEVSPAAEPVEVAPPPPPPPPVEEAMECPAAGEQELKEGPPSDALPIANGTAEGESLAAASLDVTMTEGEAIHFMSGEGKGDSRPMEPETNPHDAVNGDVMNLDLEPAVEMDMLLDDIHYDAVAH